MTLISKGGFCEPCGERTVYFPDDKGVLRCDDCGATEHQDKAHPKRSPLYSRTLVVGSYTDSTWNKPRPVDCAGGALARNPDEAARLIEASGGYAHPADDSGLPSSVPVAPMDPAPLPKDNSFTRGVEKILESHKNSR